MAGNSIGIIRAFYLLGDRVSSTRILESTTRKATIKGLLLPIAPFAF